MPANNTRTWILGGVALSLVAVVALHYGLGNEGASARSDEAVRARIETLRRVVAGKSALTAQYAELGTSFAERFAEVASYQTKGKVRPEAIVSTIRGQLAAISSLQNLTVTQLAQTPSGDGIGRLIVNVAFAAPNDRQALEAIHLFARPETGFAWQTLSVTADRKERRVTVTGKVAALMVDPVE